MSSPAIKFRDGCLQVVVWRNHGERGHYYTVNTMRSYKQSDDTWKDTDSLNADDLLPIAELLREAYAWIRMQKRADTKARREADQVTAK
jgi:hypothetical protein